RARSPCRSPRWVAVALAWVSLGAPSASAQGCSSQPAILKVPVARSVVSVMVSITSTASVGPRPRGRLVEMRRLTAVGGGPRGGGRVPGGRGRFAVARFQPGPDLAELVEHYWTVSWDLRG